MSDSVHIAGPVAFLKGSSSAVFFSQVTNTAGKNKTSKGTAAPVKEMQTALKVALWGEDNRFPQNIEQEMAYCGIGKAGLNWKAKALWGSGIIPGKVTGYEDEGKKEIFVPLDRIKYKVVYDFIEDRSFFRFWLEFLQDWVWYSNCFPEMILSADCNTITGFVHQESCDCRFKQMNDKGEIDTVYLSKLWGSAASQYARFDPDKRIRYLIENNQNITEVDNKFVKALDCIDMYDALNSLTEIGKRLKKTKGLKSAILPVNYPSVNKTYYQVAAWDGARLSGWVKIAGTIPEIVKALFEKAFSIKYHIEIPYTYYERKFGYETWHSMLEPMQKIEITKVLKEMDDFLTGKENAFKTFVSHFEVSAVELTEHSRIKITVIDDKSTLEKELVTASAADVNILTAMEVNPTLFGAGTFGTGKQQSGGSNIREAFLVYTSLLNLERQVFLEPLYLVRDYNREVGGVTEWEKEIVFRVRDIVLTTLDTGAGTTKQVS